VATSSHLLAAATSSTSWTFQGPAPELNAQQDLFNVATADEPVSGNVVSIAPSPTNANTVYIGAANGGVWKTTNATAASPTWTPLTDNLKSLSIGPIAFDPTDPTEQRLVVGTGRFSGLGSTGDDLAGLYYTNDGGLSWTTTTSTLLSAASITGVAARGDTLLATSANGLFRTTTGPLGTWTKISTGTPGVLPDARASALVADPIDTNRLYATFTGASGGIFRTDDLGATWTNLTSNIAGISSATTFFNAAVYHQGATNVIYVMLDGTVGGVTKKSVYRSTDNGSSWTSLDVPTGGFFQGNNAQINVGMSVDKTNPNLVYLGGHECIGANPFRPVVYRLDASVPAGQQPPNPVQATGLNTLGEYGVTHADVAYLTIDRCEREPADGYTRGPVPPAGAGQRGLGHELLGVGQRQPRDQ